MTSWDFPGLSRSDWHLMRFHNLALTGLMCCRGYSRVEISIDTKRRNTRQVITRAMVALGESRHRNRRKLASWSITDKELHLILKVAVAGATCSVVSPGKHQSPKVRGEGGGFRQKKVLSRSCHGGFGLPCMFDFAVASEPTVTRPTMQASTSRVVTQISQVRPQCSASGSKTFII